MSKLTAAEIRTLIQRAEDKANELGVKVSISLVDDGGHLLGFLRMDGAAPGPAEVSQSKARVAALFRRESGEFGRNVRERPLTGMETMFGGMALFNGGVPVRRGGEFIGGMGVAGATADQDLEVVRYALELLAE